MNTPETTLTALLELAADAATTAGRALADRASGWNDVRVESGKDIKIEADVNAEAIILEKLAAGSDIAILSEEKGWTGSQDDYCWVVDPLDGTANYTQAIPFCCVSIALMQGWKPVLGVIYDFNHDDLFTGATGIEAMMNGAPMQPGTRTTTDKSVLVTGFPANRDFSPEALARFAGDVGGWRKVRMLGSAALSLAYIACGRADAYREENVMLWDVAAGCALVEAAGGTVKISGDDRNKPVTVNAANAALIKTLPDT